MSKLDPRIEAIRVKYDLEPTDFWELPQKKGTWVAKHSALEVAAFRAGIHFNAPQIIEADTAEGIAVLAVEGHVATMEGVLNSPVRREWATGEASPKNNKNAYPWAMAEKRAKDRVILKLIGIHGLVYSEDELSEPTPERSSEPRVAANPVVGNIGGGGGTPPDGGGPATPGDTQATVYARLWTKMETLDGDALIKWQNRPEVAEAFKGLPEKERLNLNDAINQKLGK